MPAGKSPVAIAVASHLPHRYLAPNLIYPGSTPQRICGIDSLQKHSFSGGRLHTMTTRLATILILVASIGSPLEAQWQSVGRVQYYEKLPSSTVLLNAENLSLEIRVLADDLFRMRYVPQGRSISDSSWAVVKTHWAPVDITVADSGGAVHISTRELTLAARKDPLRLVFHDADGNVVNADHSTKGMAWSGGETRIWKAMPQAEHYYGFGEKAGRFERKWTHMAMWNSDIPAYGADTDPLYKSVPFFYGIADGKAYGIFLDSPHWSSFDMGKETHDQYSFGTQDSVLTYYFLYGPEPVKVLERFTELVGRMPLPPRWSLGYQQCRWSYTPAQRVREIADGFRQRGIPCDVLYLDIDYMDGYRIFTWHPDNFPDPGKLVADLSRNGFKVAVILDPGIKVDSTYHAYVSGSKGNHFVTYPDGSVFVGEVWPGRCAFPDFTDPSTRR